MILGNYAYCCRLIFQELGKLDNSDTHKRYQAIAQAFSELVHDRVNAYRISHDPNNTQRKWQDMVEVAKRRVANEKDDDDDESGGEYFQMTKGDITVARGAIKGTIEAIVSTAKGAEKKRRRNKADTNSSPKTAAEDIVREIDELSDRQWRNRRIKDNIMDAGTFYEPDERPIHQRRQKDGIEGQILDTRPETNLQLEPEDDIFPSDSLSSTTATPSPPPATLHTITTSVASSNTTTMRLLTPPRKGLVPFVIIYTRPKSKPKSRSASPCLTISATSSNNKPFNKRKRPSQLLPSPSPSYSRSCPLPSPSPSTIHRTGIHQPRCEFIFFYPRKSSSSTSDSSTLLSYKPRLTVDRLVMLCARARIKLKKGRSRSRSRSRVRIAFNKSGSNNASVIGSTTGGFLRRNLKVGRARRGSLTGRMKIKLS